jgi:hypothetical protein
MMSVQTAMVAGVTHLYRYQRFDPERLRPALEGRLFCSSPAAFNDPWDCHPYFDPSLVSGAEGLEKVIGWLAGRMPHRAREQRKRELRIQSQSSVDPILEELSLHTKNQIDRDFRICCFSENSDIALMWAHYTDSHKGVCLEFDASTECVGLAMKVDYCDSRRVSDGSRESHVLALTSKSKVWEYENEYRFITLGSEKRELDGVPFDAGHFPDKDNFLQLPTGALLSIIVGCCMPEANLVALRALVDRYNSAVMLKKAVRARGTYDLLIEPI